MVETAQSIMNWMTFMDAPTWYWLHALTPTYNSESEGYGLGLWRPSDDPIEAGDPYADIAPQHWRPIKTNWHGVAPFVHHLPWDSTRLQVDEKTLRKSQRIMAWESPDGSAGLALTNRSGQPRSLSEHRQIVDAIASQDAPRARALTESHLRNAYAALSRAKR
jgi:hypothetical protein